MDEEYLAWLLLIPGIGRKRAERLAAKFPTTEALRAASVEDLASLDGIGETLATQVKEFLAKSEGADDFWYKGEAGLYLCPTCGALIAKDATKCPSCGTEFDGEEPGAAEAEGEMPDADDLFRDFLEPKGQELNLCPECGAFVGKDATKCPSCGTSLERGEAPAPAEAPIVAEEKLQPEGQGLYLCPSCGALVGAFAATCPKCGASLEGEEAAPPAEAEQVAELPPEAITGAPSLFVCTNCGAFLRAEDTKCPSCGVEFEEGEV